MPESNATIAEYFRRGLEAGLVEPDQARRWADSVIVEASEAPGEIIEVSWSKNVSQLIGALAEVSGERNKSLAGKWLLGLLRQELEKSDDWLDRAPRRAMQVIWATGLGDELYYRFDQIDDELSLAETGQYGTLDSCRKKLDALLGEFPVPPFKDE